MSAPRVKIDTIERLRVLRRDLEKSIEMIDTTLAALQAGPLRASRPYDIPMDDPEIVAERFGVAPAPDDGPIPQWVSDRLGSLVSVDE